jgi:hypothetical protein
MKYLTKYKIFEKNKNEYRLSQIKHYDDYEKKVENEYKETKEYIEEFLYELLDNYLTRDLNKISVPPYHPNMKEINLRYSLSINEQEYDRFFNELEISTLRLSQYTDYSIKINNLQFSFRDNINNVGYEFTTNDDFKKLKDVIKMNKIPNITLDLRII